MMSNECAVASTRSRISQADCRWSASIVPRDVWLQICLYLSVESLYMLRATSRAMRDTVDSRTVWLTVLEDLAGIMPSPYSIEDVNNMSTIELREAVRSTVLVNRAYSSPTLPHHEIELISHEDLIPEYRQTTLFPGGEHILILSDDGSFDILDINTTEVVTHVPTLKADWPRSQTTAQLFPSSRSAGYIVVQMINRSGILEPFDGPLSGQDFRVYKYSGTDVTYMFREKSSFSGINPVYAVGLPEEGVLTLAQAYQPIRDNPAVVDVMLRTFFADGNDKKVVTRFLIEALTEVSLEVNKPGPVSVYSRIQMVSPRFLLLQAPHHITLFDVSVFQVRESDREVKVLQPVWKSAAESNLQIHHDPPCTIPYFIDGRPPFVRVMLWTYPHRLLFMDLSSSEEDTEAHNGIISLSHTDVSGLLPNYERDNDAIIHEVFGGFVSGLIRFQTWTFFRVSPPQLGSHSDKEGLWSYVATSIHGHSENEAGMIRLAMDLEGSSQARLGNTSRRWRPSSGLDDSRTQFSVDDISGRFIRFKPAYRGDPPAGGSASITLYAFDQEAIDSFLTPDPAPVIGSE